MAIMGFFAWWYGAGWRERLNMIGARLSRLFDTFSLDLLVKTWFSPFRQIGTGRAARSFSEQLSVFFDQLVSRVVGGVVRTIMIMLGVVALLVTGILGVAEGVLWAFVPLLPVAGAVLFAIGWVPYVGL